MILCDARDILEVKCATEITANSEKTKTYSQIQEKWIKQRINVMRGNTILKVLRRWFNHRDVSESINYINEPISEKLVSHCQAEYLADEIAQNSPWTVPLKEVLFTEYGISDVSLVPRADIANCIEALIKFGCVRVTVSPHLEFTLTKIP